MPAVYVLGVLLLPGAAASFTPPRSAEWLVFPGLIGFIATLLIGGPLLEEPGWRGFALPHLQPRFGPLGGTVLLGVLWAVWHFSEYVSSPSFAATNGGGLTPRAAGTFVLFAVSLSFIITWVFNHTRGSLLLAVLVHTAVNWSQLLTS